VTAVTAVASRAPVRPTRALAPALASIAVGAACLLRLEPSGLALVQASVAGLLVWLAAIDLEFRVLPNRIILPATAAVLALTAVIEPSLALEHALAAVGAGAFLLVAALLRRGALGMGDVKLAILVGAMLGASVVTALIVGFGAVAIVGVGLIARSGRKGLKQEVPLGPYLALGAFVALVAGG
jgi:prepilin signal peptidase PulO-like enzyme (type II secretory pathway)